MKPLVAISKAFLFIQIIILFSYFKFMPVLVNNKNESIRLTDERFSHIESDHPEMKGQLIKIEETLITPETVEISKSDSSVELYYKFYSKTPVTSKYMCVVVKNNESDKFIVTSYFTDKIKKGK